MSISFKRIFTAVLVIISLYTISLLSTLIPKPAVNIQYDAKAEVAKYKEKQKSEIRDKYIDNAIESADVLKKSMRNPDKFKMSEAILMGNGSVCYEYRAENGFGGMNIGSAVFRARDRKLVTDEMGGFQKIWNKECTGKSGENITHYF